MICSSFHKILKFDIIRVIYRLKLPLNLLTKIILYKYIQSINFENK